MRLFGAVLFDRKSMRFFGAELMDRRDLRQHRSLPYVTTIKLC